VSTSQFLYFREYKTERWTESS